MRIKVISKEYILDNIEEIKTQNIVMRLEEYETIHIFRFENNQFTYNRAQKYIYEQTRQLGTVFKDKSVNDDIIINLINNEINFTDHLIYQVEDEDIIYMIENPEEPTFIPEEFYKK